MKHVILQAKRNPGAEFLVNEKIPASESFLTYEDILKTLASKMNLQFEKLLIEDSKIHFTDEAPNGDFNFMVRDRRDDVEYLVEVFGNRKDLQVRQPT